MQRPSLITSGESPMNPSILRTLKFITPMLIAGFLGGCSGATSPAKGGTAGALMFGPEVTSDILVTVYQKNDTGFQSIGFGTTAVNGSFILYNTGATEPLWLEPGDYKFTLESIGPPVRFPAPYTTPESSPLHVNWNSDMTSLVLQAPENLLRG
jgi:hypothetical protein